MNCEEFNELSGAFALGGVTPTERAEARAHLQNCEKCTKLWLEQQAVVDLLPLSVPQIDPAPDVKERLFARVLNEPKPANLGKPIPISTRQPQAFPVPQSTENKRRWWPLVALLGLLCLSLGLGAWNLSLEEQLTAHSQQIVSQKQQASTLLQQVHTLQGQVTRTFTLKGQPGEAHASGELLYIPQDNLTVLTLTGLPELKGAAVYQGWLLHNNHPTSIGLLFMQNGLASLTYHGDITSFELAAVSLEPGPTPSPGTPSGPLVALGTLKV